MKSWRDMPACDAATRAARRGERGRTRPLRRRHRRVPDRDSRLFSWDRLTSSGDFLLEQQPNLLGNIFNQGPRLSMSAAGTFVGAFHLYTTAADPSGWAAYLQPFQFADNNDGTFSVTAQGNAFRPYTDGTGDQIAIPVVAPDGSFVAVVGSAPSGIASADIFLRHYAADGTSLDADPIPVATTPGDQQITGAALDGGGNLVVSWREGGWGYDWSLYARRFDADGAPLTDPMRITPTTASYHPWSGGSVAVAPNGSLMAVWTTYYTASSAFGVEARHYDPIYDSVTETSTLRTTARGGVEEDVVVDATATVFDDHILWEYRVQNVSYRSIEYNHDTTYVGLFTVFSSAPTTHATNGSGWNNFNAALAGGMGAGWVSPEGGSLLAPGSMGYFSFTTVLTAIGHGVAHAGEADYAYFADGLVLAPVGKSLTADLTDYIPVNANNDNWNGLPSPAPGQPDTRGAKWASKVVPGLNNGQPVVQTGIPRVRDFKATNLPVDDPELKPLTINWMGNGGTITVTAISTGAGRLKFWQDAKKRAAFTQANLPANVGNGTVTVYVEGLHESTGVKEVTVLVKWVDSLGVTDTWTKKVTVTPVILDFGVLLSTGPGPGQTVNFLKWDIGPPATSNGLLGLGARAFSDKGVDNKQSVLFRANVVDIGLYKMSFVQNLMAVQDGANGSAAGIVFTPGSGLANMNLGPLAHPFLDSDNATTPYYSEINGNPLNNKPTAAPDGYRQYLDVDGPTSGIPITATGEPDTPKIKKIATIDVKDSFRLYLVVRYEDGSLYTVAYVNWTVNFFADQNDPNKGVTNIRDKNGVRKDDMVPSNDDPFTTAPPFAVGGLNWH